MASFPDDGGYLFEAAQYYAYKADYEKAIGLYEKAWTAEAKSKPRFTDTLEGIAEIYGIMGERDKVIETYGRIIDCLKDEWNMDDDCLTVIEFEEKKKQVK